MKLYNPGGISELTTRQLFERIYLKRLFIRCGVIDKPKILERKFLSNKGNALDFTVMSRPAAGYRFNIGGNPIGTGWENYIQFLDEIGCEKVGHLYRLNSIVGKQVGFLETKMGRVDGYFVPGWLID